MITRVTPVSPTAAMSDSSDILAAIGAMKGELLAAMGVANARTDSIELQLQGLQAQQVTSGQEMQSLVSTMQEIPTGDGLGNHGQRERLARLQRERQFYCGSGRDRNQDGDTIS